MEERMSRCSVEGGRLGGAPGAVAGAAVGYLHGGAESKRPRRSGMASWGSSEIGGGGEDVGCGSGCESCRGGRVRSHSRQGCAELAPPLVSSCSRDLLLISAPARCSLDACRLVRVLSCTLDPPTELSAPASPATPIPAIRSSLEAWMLWVGPSRSLDPPRCSAPSSRRRGSRSRLSRERCRRASESRCSREE